MANWWAINHRRIAVILARLYLVGGDRLSAEDNDQKATCLYLSGLYDAWEQCLLSNGHTTVRKVEQSFVWDPSIGPWNDRTDANYVNRYPSGK